jgi:adenine-specific DNA glycosylase
MMLTDILEACKTSPQGLCLEEISRRLEKEPSIVEGMINQLLHMGKLVERPAQTVCETCPVRVSCIVIERSDRLYSVPMNTIKE